MTQKKAPVQLKRASEERSSSGAGKAGAKNRKVELKLHAARPHASKVEPKKAAVAVRPSPSAHPVAESAAARAGRRTKAVEKDRKSTRLNSSHRCISYAVFCLKKKNK